MTKPGRADNAPRRRISGILLLDKPTGLSSNKALQRVKGLLRAKKAGHTGSLDPEASGMLPLCFGEATKVCAFLLDADKSYRVEATFGERRSTGDREGAIVATGSVPQLSTVEWQVILDSFAGPGRQVPPMYSALHHEGRRLYELAREGIEVERPARDITLYDLSLEALDGPRVSFSVRCSKGTYVRTLVEDIAAQAGTVGYTSALRRVGVGPFTGNPMVTFEELDAHPEGVDGHLIPADAALEDWPAVALNSENCERFQAGNPVVASATEAGRCVRVYDSEQHFVGVGETGENGIVAPRRLFLADD